MIFGLSKDPLWIPDAFPMGSLWFPYELPMDPLLIPYGIPIWIPYAFHMGAPWTIYGLCLQYRILAMTYLWVICK